MSPPLSSLLVRWECAEEQGQSLTPEQLCSDRPELLAPMKEAIAVMRQLRGMLLQADSHASPATMAPGAKAAPPPMASSLLVRWERAVQQGQDPTPEALCPGRRDLHESLGRATSLLKQMRGMKPPAANGSATLGVASRYDVSTVNPGQADPAATPPIAHPVATSATIPAGYEIMGVLGRGGMGVVYRARQLALNRVVALKMILAGDHAAASERARFLAEAEAIARVKHPGIVQVYDFGTLDGLPYFSLELCEGGSLAGRLHQSPLKLREAAELVEQIARAVQAAHDAGIVHRDLKPGNVLLDAQGQPRVTDFGLAKQIEGGGQTQTGVVVGTPSYMPPEQAAGKKDVGTAADVWALGAILYECLAGRPPFRAATAMETVLSVLTDEPVSLRQMLPKLPRDLETIAHKCLQKNPLARYASAQALADDLRNYLDGHPIAARPVGRLERLARWCRRNPAVTALSAAALLFLWTGLIGMTVLYIRAEDQRRVAEKAREFADVESERAKIERDLAQQYAAEAEAQKKKADAQRQATEEHAARARQASKILTGMFDSSDPLGLNGFTFGVNHKAGQTLKASDLLERAVKLTEDDARLDPVVKAIVYHDVGNVYRSLGLHKQAEPLLIKALDIRKKHASSPNDVADSLHALAWLRHERGDYPEAEKLYRESLEQRDRAAEVNEAAKLNTLINLGWLCMEMEEAEEGVKLFEAVLKGRIRLFGEDHRETALARISMAGAYLKMGRALDAYVPMQRAIEDLKKLGIDRNVINAVTQLQNALIQEQLYGNRGKAIELLRGAVTLTRQTLGERHLYVVLPLMQLAIVEENDGRFTDAFGHFSEAFEIGKDVVGLTHPQMLLGAEHLAAHHRRIGQSDKGSALLKDVLDAKKEQYGEKHVFVADSLMALAFHERESGKADRAHALYEEAEAIYALSSGRLPRRHGICLREMGHHLYRQGKYADSEKPYRKALEINRRRHKEPHGEVAWSILNLLSSMAHQGKHDREFRSLRVEAGTLIESLPQGQRPPLHIEWAVLSAQMLSGKDGDHLEAAKVLDRHAKDAKQYHEYEDLARAYVGCVTALGRDGRLEAGERARLRERYAASAVAQLRLWWKASASARLQWGAAEWAPLRQEPVFVALCKEAKVTIKK